jgi:hypothetical protein
MNDFEGLALVTYGPKSKKKRKRASQDSDDLG